MSPGAGWKWGALLLMVWLHIGLASLVVVYVPNPRTACRVVPNSVFATDSLRGMCPRVKLITAVAS